MMTTTTSLSIFDVDATTPCLHHMTIIAAARMHFMNVERARRSNLFTILGLTWGATLMEIKDLYHHLVQEFHPDVLSLDPSVASGRFCQVREAYDILMNNNNRNGMMHGSESREGWSFWTWQSGDMIMRKRPVRPAASRRGNRR